MKSDIICQAECFLTEIVDYTRLGHNRPITGSVGFSANTCLMDFSWTWPGLADNSVFVLALEDVDERVAGGNKKNDKNSDSARRSCKVYVTGWVWENMMRSSCDRGVYNLHIGQINTVWQFCAVLDNIQPILTALVMFQLYVSSYKMKSCYAAGFWFGGGP